MSRRDFHLVHLSDLHLTTSERIARSEPRLFGKLRGMNGYFAELLKCPTIQSADRILITGDVTDTGALAEWEHFWRVVKVAGIKDRTVVVPGNHDVCNRGLRIAPKAETAKNDQLRLLEGLRLGMGTDLGRGFPLYVELSGNIGLFVLNSNNLGNISALDNAVGHIGYYELLEFAVLLRKHRDVPVKIVALHHSPNIPEPATDIARGRTPLGTLERLLHQIPEAERRALRLLCISHSVRLIVHGHLHREESRRVNGLRIIGAPASTEPAVIEGKNGLRFWHYTISEQSLRIRCKIEHVRL